MNIENTKIRIGDNPELSEVIQKRLFEFGVKWWINGSIASYTSKPFLYIDSRKCISYGVSEEVFLAHECKEIPAASLLIPEGFMIKVNSKEEKVKVINLLIGVGYKSFNGENGEEYVKRFAFYSEDVIMQKYGGFTFLGGIISGRSINFTIDQLEEVYKLVNKSEFENKADDQNKMNPNTYNSNTTSTSVDIKSRFPSVFTVESARNPERKKIVYKMLESAGYEDPYNRANKVDEYPGSHVYIDEDGELNGMVRPAKHHFSFEQFVSIYNGFKEFTPKPKLPEINGYPGKFDKENSLITYGCAEIPARLFKDLNRWITETSGNRHVSSITLNSGVIIFAEQIKEVCIFLEANI